MVDCWPDTRCPRSPCRRRTAFGGGRTQRTPKSTGWACRCKPAPHLVPELLRAGAECLVAPIRPIADVDASLVMRHFYRHLPDASVAGALARTRLDLLDQAPRVQAAGHAFLAFGRGHAVLG